MKSYIISGEDENVRLDRFLFRILPGAGRGFLEKMLRKKNIVLNDKKTRGNARLRTGDEIKIYFSDETFNKFSFSRKASDLYDSIRESDDYTKYIDIIFEDDELLVLNKPQGLLSQRDSRGIFSLNEHMISYLIHSGELSREDFADFSPSVMNRLDFNTSGIVLAAKTRNMARSLSTHIKNNNIKKTYRALVLGRFEYHGVYRSYLKKDASANRVSLYREPVSGAKETASVFNTVSSSDEFSLVNATLITGRSHQLRAQLSQLGHPVVLDPKYGDLSANRKIIRAHGLSKDAGQLLHSWQVELFDGRRFEAPLPQIFHEIGEL